MKTLLIALLLLLPVSLLAGGPSCSPSASNDACSGITLTVDDPCVNGTTCNATLAGGEDIGCGSVSTDQTVWYKFTATENEHCVSIERTGGGGCFLGSAIWDGCSGNQIACEDAASGPNTQTYCSNMLTIGTIYYIQIQYGSGGPCGSHTEFCIQATTTCSTCDDPCGDLCVLKSTDDPADCSPTYDYTLSPPASSTSSYTQCYTFTATGTDVTFQTGLTFSGCGTVQSLTWELYDNACGLFDSGDLSDWSSSGLTIGNDYTHCIKFLPCVGGVFTVLRPRAIMDPPPLPIELIELSCGETKQGLSIVWTTASETNNYIFILEHSVDGIEFSKIRQIPGAGTSNELNIYSILHSEPTVGINWYRLTQVDYDGTKKSFPLTACLFDPEYTYSEIVEIFTWDGRKVEKVTTSGMYVTVTTKGNRKTYKKEFYSGR